MSPYAALYSHPVDQAIAWLLVLAWLAGGVFAMRNHVRLAEAGPERYCEAAAWAFLMLSAVIAVNFGVGLVFLVWLKITSAFWFVWQLFYLMSVICVFWAMPVFAVSLLAWAAVGRFRGHYGRRSLMLCAACLLGLAVDALLYFCLEASTAVA